MARRKLRDGFRAAIKSLLKRRLCMVIAQRVLSLRQSEGEGWQAGGRQGECLVDNLGSGQQAIQATDEDGTASDEIHLLSSWRSQQQIACA